MVADLRQVVFSLFCLKMQQCKNTKTRQSTSLSCLRVFAFSDFKSKKVKIRQKKGENTTHKMCRPFAFYLSYICFIAFKIQKCENTKIRQSATLSCLRVLYCYIFALLDFRIFTFSLLCFFTLLDCYIFAFSRSVCTCALRLHISLNNNG